MHNQINNVKNELKSDINELRNMMASYFKKDTASTSGSGSLPSNTIANPMGDLKAITTRSGVSYDGPPIPPPFSSLPKVVKRVPEVTKDTVQPTTTPVNENCSAVILKKLPEKLVDPGKFLIPCDFPELDECLALSDLGASINFTPLSIWRKLSLPELTSTQMILELADRSTTRPADIAEAIFVKVGKTGRALIDVYGEELTLRVDDEAIIFKVGQTSKYSYNDAESINRIDIIDVAYPIISSSSPSFTPFEGSDFILEEIKTFLRTSDELFNLDDDYYDAEGDILYLEKFLNEDPSSNLPSVNTRDLKQVDATMTKPSLEKPPELELKELPSHLKYAFLERIDKLPVIIYKELKDEEKSALLKIKKRLPSLVLMERLPTDVCLLVYVMLQEKYHFMIKEGIVLGHKISKFGIEVDRAKVDVIAKLPHPSSVKGENRASWSDKLDDALWAFRTAFKTPIGIAPDLEASRARGFVHHPLELQSLAYENPIS
uniref:Reverse transcriptase domain-containing protein n=1 Tax=Tanacetum cinerariifolium TaxID=118510 RepID=A0A699H9H4_TANCI|nr:reverse transcriptase domain-containing protein [Tanacetum cinerariifolium]